MLEVVQRGVDFVDHRRFELVQLIGAPPQTDLLLKLVAKVLLLLAAHRAFRLEALKQIGHPPALVTHGVAHDFGWVGRENQTDVEFLQHGFHLRWRNIHPPKSLEHLPKCGRIGLTGQRRGEGIKGLAGLIQPARGGEAFQVAVLFDALFEDVDELEIEREGPCCSDCLGQIHRADELDDGVTAALAVPTLKSDRITQLFEPQQTSALFRRAFTAKNVLPQVFDQLEPLMKESDVA